MLVTALLAATLAAPVPKAKAVERPSLDGRWKLVESNTDGVSKAATAGLCWVIRGEELAICVGDTDPPADGWGMALSAPKEGGANAIDYVVKYGNGTKSVRPGVFELSGDTLTVCLTLTDERPPDVKGGKGRKVLAFKRVETTKK